MYSPYYQPYWSSSDELEHFGIKGMKWGIRRYQNPDGTLTEAGKSRYGGKISKAREEEYRIRDRASKKYLESVEKAIEKHPDTKYFKAEKNQLKKFVEEETKAINSMTDKELLDRSRGRKVGYTTAALLEVGSAASLVGTIAAGSLLTPAGVAASSVLGIAWVTTFMSGALVANSTANKYAGDTSEYAKNIKEGMRWLGGDTYHYSSKQIAEAEEKARKSGRGSFQITTSTGGGWLTRSIPISLIDRYADM